MGTHPIFESDFDCLTASQMLRLASRIRRKTVRWASSSSEDFVDTKSFRSDVKQVHLFDPMLNYDDFFGVLDKIKWQDLAINRMQYGHHESVRDPYMAQYLLVTCFTRLGMQFGRSCGHARWSDTVCDDVEIDKLHCTGRCRPMRRVCATGPGRKAAQGQYQSRFGYYPSSCRARARHSQRAVG